MRIPRIVLASVAAVSGWGCSVAGSHPAADAGVLITQSPSPFTHVAAGEVRGVVLDDWVVAPIRTSVRSGFTAAPDTGRADADGFPVGMSASWVDATRVGVPSDYYYLAANGPALSRLTTSTACRERSVEIYLNRRPTLDPDRWSPGHFMASGEGICRRGERAARFAYFVAAPGYGPVHEVGIPRSGLYVVVAVVPDGRHAGHQLRTLIHRTRFGDAGVREFVAAARPLT